MCPGMLCEHAAGLIAGTSWVSDVPKLIRSSKNMTTHVFCGFQVFMIVFMFMTAVTLTVQSKVHFINSLKSKLQWCITLLRSTFLSCNVAKIPNTYIMSFTDLKKHFFSVSLLVDLTWRQKVPPVMGVCFVSLSQSSLRWADLCWKKTWRHVFPCTNHLVKVWQHFHHFKVWRQLWGDLLKLPAASIKMNQSMPTQLWWSWIPEFLDVKLFTKFKPKPKYSLGIIFNLQHISSEKCNAAGKSVSP